MSFEMNKFSVVKKKKLEQSSFQVECNVDCADEIDKILSVCHSAQADTAEVLGGVVNYSGSIDLCILYLTVDGSVGTLTSSCPFTSTFSDAEIALGDKVGISLQVTDYTIDSIASGNIKITCQIQQSGMLIQPAEVGAVSSHDEEICQKTDSIFVNTLVGQASENFVVESEFSLKEPIRKVVSCDSSVAVKGVECGVNFVSVTGEVITRILYYTESDRFESAYMTENFKEEIELEGVTRDGACEAVANVRKNAVVCEIESAERGVNVKVTSPVVVQVTAYLEKEVEVVRDVYSTESELTVTTSSFEMTNSEIFETFEEKIDGALTLDDDKPRVDKLMFVGGSNVCVTNAYVKDGEVTVEGVTKTSVVYLNDETNSLHSVIVEVPFVVSDKTEADENATITVRAMLCDVDVGVKKGREFLFDGKLKIEVNFSSETVGAVISAIEQAEMLAERDCAIELVFASAGQSAWDVAKAVKVKEEQIYVQNPDLTFPLEQDENVVVYYKLR